MNTDMNGLPAARRSSSTFTAPLLGIVLCLVSGCGVSSGSTERQVAPPLHAETRASGSVGHDATVDDFAQFALNALLLPLLDDDVPARWADPSLSVDCNDAHVTVDGRRPDVGAPVPEKFKVRWHMDDCVPLGEYMKVSGDVELEVELGAGGYRARVKPDGLTVRTSTGLHPVTGAFTATLTADSTQGS